jgi:hypothetical protein
MCCLFTTLVMLGPRAAIVVWWLLQPARWGLAFDTFIVPLIGFLILPWTTLVYVAVFPNGFDWIDIFWLGLAVAIDLMSWAGGTFGNRSRIPGRSAY